MKETLKLDLIAPYGKGVKYLIPSNVSGEIRECIGSYEQSGITYVCFEESDKYRIWHDIEDCYMILRKMELTKPIFLEGEEIIPLEVIGKIINSDYQHLDTDKEGNAIIGYDEHKSCCCPFDCDCGSYNKSYILFYKAETKNFYSTVYIDADPDNIIGEETHESYEAIKWLYENKFDIENLIEQNLAIDVETLESNPYE